MDEDFVLVVFLIFSVGYVLYVWHFITETISENW